MGFGQTKIEITKEFGKTESKDYLFVLYLFVENTDLNTYRVKLSYMLCIFRNCLSSR